MYMWNHKKMSEIVFLAAILATCSAADIYLILGIT